jgi:hypothetical protein
VNKPNQNPVPGKLRLKNIASGYVAGQPARTFNFDAILENSDLYVTRNAVVAVENSVGNDFM